MVPSGPYSGLGPETARAAVIEERAFGTSGLPSATFQLDTDVSQLFPYIDAVADDAVYYEEPRVHASSPSIASSAPSIAGQRGGLALR